MYAVVPEAAYPYPVSCLSFASSCLQLLSTVFSNSAIRVCALSLPVSCLEVAAEAVGFHCCVLPVPYSLCTGRTVSVQTASHTAVELTDAHSPSSSDIGELVASESEPLGSTVGGPYDALFLELLCLSRFLKLGEHETYTKAISWIGELPGQDLDDYYTKRKDVKLSRVGFGFIQSFR